MQRPTGPAYSIHTARTRLRCFKARDTAALSSAIAGSHAHLKPFMSWIAHEPLDFEARLNWVRTQRGHFELGSDYCFGVWNQDESALLGVAALKMCAEVSERELGYWVHADHIRSGFGTEIADALLRVAFDVEQLDAVTARMLPENLASAALVRTLGFEGPTLDPQSAPGPAGEKYDTHVYSMGRLAYRLRSRPLPAVHAFDDLGRSVL